MTVDLVRFKIKVPNVILTRIQSPNQSGAYPILNITLFAFLNSIVDNFVFCMFCFYSYSFGFYCYEKQQKV